MSRKVYLDFQDGSGWRDVSDLVKYDTLQVHTRAFSDNFHFAQNNATFQVIYDSTIYPLIKASTKDILVNIFDLFESTELTAETDSWLMTESGDSLIRGTTPIFYGHVPFTKSRSYNGILNNTHYSLEAIDDIDYLDVKVEDICYVDYKIMDSTDTAHSIVHQLAYVAGWTDARVDNLMTISNVISYFVPPSEEDLVKDLLDTLLFEYGYSLNINEAGQISPIKWRKDADDPVFQFNNGNIVKEIQIQDSLNPYDSVEVTYYEVAQASTEDSANILLYRDSNLPYSDNGGFLGYPVPSGYLYPPEANVIDTVTGSGQIVYQDYDDTALKYWTNEAIVNKIDYNYKAFKSDYSDMLYTSDHFVDWYGDSNISLVSSSFGNKKARVVFSGSSSTNNNLYYFNIYGKVIYKSAERKAIKNNVTDPSKTDRYVSTFIYDATSAEALTLALAAIYDAGNTIYTMTSDNDRFLGENSQVYLNDGTNQNCILMEKIYDESTELWTFVLKAYSKDRGALDESTSSLAPKVVNNDIISASIVPNNFSVPALIDGSIPNLTGASTELTVYRGMFDDSMGWSYNATVSGVSGSFGTGLQKNIYTVSGFDSLATTQGRVVITASRAGFNDVSGTYVIQKIFQSDATTSGMVNDQIVTKTPTYAPRYYGKYLDTTPSGSFVTGDVFCRYSTSSGTTNRGIFKWDGDSWERTEATAEVTKALSDISFLIAYTNISGTKIYGQASDYSGDSTVQANFAFFQSAVIGYLEAEKIKLQANGAIYGGDRYTDIGADNNTAASGFWLGANGIFKADKGTISAATISGGSIYGSYITSVSGTTTSGYIPSGDRNKPRTEFDLTNASLVFRDDVTTPGQFRKIEIGPNKGLRASDKSSNIIHDIPSAALNTENLYQGHFFSVRESTSNAAALFIGSYNVETASDVSTSPAIEGTPQNFDLSTYLPADPGIKAVVIQSLSTFRISSNKIDAGTGPIGYSFLNYGYGSTDTPSNSTICELGGTCVPNGASYWYFNGRGYAVVPVFWSSGKPYIRLSVSITGLGFGSTPGSFGMLNNLYLMGYLV